MPTQQEHLENINKALKALAEREKTNPDPFLKEDIQAISLGLHGIDLRMLNDERKDRIVEGTDKAISAMGRRMRSGRNIVSNKDAAGKIRQMQDWMAGWTVAFEKGHEKQEPPKTVMDLPSNMQAMILCFQALSYVAKEDNMSASLLHHVIDQSYNESKEDDISARTYLGIAVLYLCQYANTTHTDLEQKLFAAQSKFQSLSSAISALYKKITLT